MPSTCTAKNASGLSFHRSSNTAPSRPTCFHGGMNDVSKPVAQTIRSNPSSVPSAVRMPVAVIRSIGSQHMRALGWWNASR